MRDLKISKCDPSLTFGPIARSFNSLDPPLPPARSRRIRQLHALQQHKQFDPEVQRNPGRRRPQWFVRMEPPMPKMPEVIHNIPRTNRFWGMKPFRRTNHMAPKQSLHFHKSAGDACTTWPWPFSNQSLAS